MSEYAAARVQSPLPSPVLEMTLQSLSRPATTTGSNWERICCPDFWSAVGSASASIGSEKFYDRLLDVLGVLVEVDLLALVRYSNFGAPSLIIPRENRADIEVPYNSGLYAFDPFHQYWQSKARPAVTSLRELAPAGLWQSRYAQEFLQAARISDEIAVFLPPLGGASPTLVLDRAEGRFTDGEISRVITVFPLMAGLHEAHIKAIVNRNGASMGDERPLRIVDRCGRELSANIAWKKLVTEVGSGLATALSTLTNAVDAKISLPHGRILHRSALAADFVAAPDGLCDEIEVASPASRPSGYHWLDPLTQREREIVMLTLEGHPIAGIAKRLGLRSGTVKNHRLRLYQKLDITTERELFLTHMRHLQGLAA